MADIELVIKIDEETYKNIKADTHNINIYRAFNIYNAIANGTPLDGVLKKIQAEIRHFMYDINPHSSESDYACVYILEIINKYKKESEDKQ